MVCKKINIKKSQGGTITGIVLSIIFVIGIFSGMYLYFNDQTTRGGVTLDSKYNDTYNKLDSAQATLDNNINNIQTNMEDIREADNTYQTAWNGLKGLGNVLTLPLSFTSSAVDTVGAMILPLGFVPEKTRNLIIMGIIAVVILIILANLKGEPKT